MREPTNWIDNALTVAQAATRAGVSRQTIYTAVQTGRLPARKVGQAWLIQSADLATVRFVPNGAARRGLGIGRPKNR